MEKDYKKMLESIHDKLSIGLLHFHSLFSIKDSTQSVEDIVRRAREEDRSTIALAEISDILDVEECKR